MAGFGPDLWKTVSPRDSLLERLLSRPRSTVERKPAFEYRADSPGDNTRIDYQISDDGMKFRTSVVLAGKIGKDEAEEMERLFRGTWYKAVFEPSAFHLPDLTDVAADRWPLSGRQHHHITGMSVTDAVADRRLPNADQFVDMALGERDWFACGR
jgi:hypothetical protein